MESVIEMQPLTFRDVRSSEKQRLCNDASIDESIDSEWSASIAGAGNVWLIVDEEWW